MALSGSNMIDRITKNEERLDKSLESVKKLEEALSSFESNTKDIKALNKYYGSKTWFKDKEAYESGKIPRIKAGVLSEDAVWDLDDDIGNLIIEMQRIINDYKK